MTEAVSCDCLRPRFLSANRMAVPDPGGIQGAGVHKVRAFIGDAKTGNLASHALGSYQNGIAVVDGDMVHFRVVNTMGRNSYYYGRPLKEYTGWEGFPDIPSYNGVRTPKSNIDMTVQWSVKIRDLQRPKP